MVGLYVHIPFCAAICNYCNFNRRLFDAELKRQYVDALLAEIRGAAEPETPADTIFFGGRLRRCVGKPEAQAGRRRARSVETDPEQVQQGHVELVRHAVEPVDRHLGHPREQLDQRDAGVGDVVLGPLRAGPVDAHPRLGDEVLEAAVVELDRRELHSLSSSGIT